MKAILIALLLCSPAYRVKGVVTLPSGQRVVIVEQTRQPRRRVVYPNPPMPSMARPRRPYAAPPVAEPLTIENPWFTLGR